MQILAAYLAVILIWSTTPLAIQWSSEGAGFLFGIVTRMMIGTVLAVSLVVILRLPMAWHRQASYTYLATSLGIYGAIMMVYWSAQFIPSGWVSLIFGLCPLVTGIMASLILNETVLTPMKVSALSLGLLGLAAIFYSGERLSKSAWMGIIGMLVSVTLHSLSAVLVKKAAYQAHGLVITSGGLLVSAPLYLLTWFLAGAEWPDLISNKNIGAIVYLGVIATVIGFALYYYVLEHSGPTRSALLTFVTPVTALWLGHVFNDERIDTSVISGTLLILSGLAVFKWGEKA